MSPIELAEHGKLPDFLLRLGIKGLVIERICSLQSWSIESDSKARREYIELIKNSPLLEHAREANEQHYELPSEFYELVLGPNLKYSSCYFGPGATRLGEAEEEMLALTAQRAGIVDGMTVLDLGCGWGSMTSYLLRTFPALKVTALSNSTNQREHILKYASESSKARLEVITADISDVQLEGRFDRIISVEMFEHCRNYQLLLKKIAGWLAPGGELFVHIFTHRSKSYLFETEGRANWMGRYFFTGGQMPSAELLLNFQDDLLLLDHWNISGKHYSKTSECWLSNIDRNRERVLQIFDQCYGSDATIWFNRWRLFFIAVSELFAFWGGNIWGISHYRFKKR